jgi:hypothetical protein
MKGILADADVRGHVGVLVQIVLSPAWREFWDYLAIQEFSFEELGLTIQSPDSLVWRACQDNEIVLITGNRNKRGPNSLEATLLRENDVTRLPVLTLSDARRVSKNKSYANTVVEKLVEYLLEIDRYRGTGRLFLP